MGCLRTDIGLFRVLVDSIPWEAVLKGKAVQEGWTCLKEELLKAQAACPHVLAVMTTSLAEQIALGLGEKWESG